MQYGSKPPMHAIVQSERVELLPVCLAPKLVVHEFEAVRASSHAAGDK